MVTPTLSARERAEDRVSFNSFSIILQILFGLRALGLAFVGDLQAFLDRADQIGIGLS